MAISCETCGDQTCTVAREMGVACGMWINRNCLVKLAKKEKQPFDANGYGVPIGQTALASSAPLGNSGMGKNALHRVDEKQPDKRCGTCWHEKDEDCTFGGGPIPGRRMLDASNCNFWRPKEAPVEEWAPKVGDEVMIRNGRDDYLEGRGPHEVIQLKQYGGMWHCLLEGCAVAFNIAHVEPA